MNFTAKDVQGLRERTGAGMMDCKKALVETDGDVEKAIDFLREKGLAKAAKKEGRIAAEGLVEEYHNDCCAALVEVNCETDFVAKTDRFKSFAKMIAKQVVEANPADLDALLASEIDGQTVSALQTAAVAEIGEKITIRRFARMEGAVDTYIHLGGTRGVLVQFESPSDPEAMHDVALQIAAASPVCVDVASLPQEFIDHERSVQLATAKEENANSAKPKPDAIVEKMVEGRMQKYYKEVCLLEQQFVKNPDITIKDMLKAKNASKVLAFVRFEKGEGIEKRKENFAEEIAKMTK
ncbi:MAG: elongation factor Ts [Clostridia bacterium]|nr:elongation factor Ts [Clostridia bacterium]